MDPEVKQLLEKNLALSQENNELLKKVHKIQRWAQITRIAYWFIILGIAFGSFYFIKPFLGSITSLYSGGVSNVNNLQDIRKSIPNIQQLQDLVKDLNQ